MPPRNKILVTGYPGSDPLKLVQEIFHATQQTIPVATTTVKDAKDGLIIPWTIDNKYYMASVDFYLDEPPVENLDATIAAYTQKGVGQVVDAFIYVLKADQADSFDGMKRWEGFVEDCDPAIRLCIAMTPPVDSAIVEDWCLAHQFDYVDMTQQEETPMDKVGVDRVVDALHTNMWDGLERKERKNDAKNLADELDQVEKMDDLEWIKEVEQLKLEHDGGFDDDFELPSKEDVGLMHDQLFGDIDQEDGLDKALQSLQAMRERGKDLPDEERRKMAAQVALSFAAQLGL